MNTAVLSSGVSVRALPLRRTLLRALPFVVCATTIAAVLATGDPTGLLASDPELAQLLRGMAILKAALLVAAAAVLTWRFGRPLPRAALGGYLAGLVAMAAATAMVWQLSALPLAAFSFHAGLLAVLLVAWRLDGAAVLVRRRPAAVRP